ncbi:MAG: hypothetical protein ACPG52_08425 [Cognaticolwellia sp.]
MSSNTPNAELFFIYDSHCPWSYAATVLVEKILSAFPSITLRAMHLGYYDGDNKVSPTTLTAVGEFSPVEFGANYVDTLNYPKDSTLVANLMAWVQNKSAKSAFELLTKLQHAHFVLGNELTDKDSVSAIIDELKLSPPAKCLQVNKLTKDAEFAIHDIIDVQELIGTQAIPAMLLACNENLVLLNHNLYLEKPDAIVEAVKAELDKFS